MCGVRTVAAVFIVVMLVVVSVVPLFAACVSVSCFSLSSSTSVFILSAFVLFGVVFVVSRGLVVSGGVRCSGGGRGGCCCGCGGRGVGDDGVVVDCACGCVGVCGVGAGCVVDGTVAVAPRCYRHVGFRDVSSCCWGQGLRGHDGCSGVDLC